MRGFGQWIEQQIDVRDAQPHQAFLGRALEIGRGEMGRPHLGGDEHVLAPDAGRAQPLAHLALVVVDLGRVDMPIAEPQRLLDEAGTDATFQLPRSEPDGRDTRSMGLDDGHRALSAVIRNT